MMELIYSQAVRDALDQGRPVVALESTLIAHGFEYPENLEVGRAIEAVVVREGAVPATIALIRGKAKIGLNPDEMMEVATNSAMPKLSLRDLSVAIGTGISGATTVASTAYLAAQAGLPVFATGGLGGVHRGARDSWDISADLLTLSKTPVVVVCSGVKSLLDIPATLEVLETFNVPVLGYRTDRFPGFYVRDSGQPVPWQVDAPESVAAVYRAQRQLGLESAIVVGNPVPEGDAVERSAHDKWIDEALADLARDGIRGKAVTPYLLKRVKQLSDSRSVIANRSLILSNAALAAQIALALCD